MIEGWISRSSQNRKWIDDNLTGKSAKWVTPQHEFWIYLVASIVTSLVWVYSLFTTFNSLWSPSPVLLDQADFARSLLYAAFVSTTEAFAVLMFLLVVLRCTFLRSPTTALLGLFSALLIMVVVGGMSHFLLIEADWGVVWANRVLLLAGQYMTEGMTQDYRPNENWRLWTILYVVSALGSAIYGTTSVSLRRFAISFSCVVLVSLLIILNPNHSNYNTYSSAMKFLYAAALGAIAFCCTYWYRIRSEEYKVNRLKAWLGLASVGVFFFSLLIMDPPEALVKRGLMDEGINPLQWGGLFVNLILATAGGVLGFGIGVVLAFGRRSSLPIFSIPATAVIELVRSGPLICWLFIAKYLFKEVISPVYETDDILRTLLMFAIFGGCYLAEVLRGGLQAVDSGQIEAATALGLNETQIKMTVLLPNAIRTTLPSIVSIFIGLWKDTTLVYILGILDFFLLAKNAPNTDLRFLGDFLEPLYVSALVFWVIAFYMSRISLNIEANLGLTKEGGGEVT